MSHANYQGEPGKRRQDKAGRLIADITLAAKGQDLVRKAGIRLFGKDTAQEKETV